MANPFSMFHFAFVHAKTNETQHWLDQPVRKKNFHHFVCVLRLIRLENELCITL